MILRLVFALVLAIGAVTGALPSWPGVATLAILTALAALVLHDERSKRASESTAQLAAQHTDALARLTARLDALDAARIKEAEEFIRLENRIGARSNR